jgi:deoxyribose-phosphate aldolase
MNPSDLAKYIDHTLLKPEAVAAAYDPLCREAAEYGFFAVCVPPSYVALAKSHLAGSEVKICTVVGFPHGLNRPVVKAFEAERAVEDGADEIDMVLNVSALKSGNHSLVSEEIGRVVVASAGRTVKVILETCFLTEEEKVLACRLAESSGAHFVKTSTGFGSGGATVADVRLLRRSIGPHMQVKASGGIRDRQTALAMIEAGASRIGASASVAILEETFRGSGIKGL